MKIYVCRVSEVVTEQTQTRIYGMIPQFRKDAADACKNETDRKRSLAASCLLYICMKQQGVPVTETPCFSPSGKMQFPQVDRFYVNLSHAKDFAVCAYDEQEIGVDVEGIRPYRESVLKRIGMAEEIAFFQKLNQQFGRGQMGKENTDAEFTKLWTRKESAVKLTGRGISALLDPDMSEKKIFTETYRPFEDMFLSVSSYSNRFCQEITVIDAISVLDF